MDKKYNKVELYKLGFGLLNDILDEELQNFVQKALMSIYYSMNDDEQNIIVKLARDYLSKNSEDEDEDEALDEVLDEVLDEHWDSELTNIVKKAFCRICGAYSSNTDHICNILLSE